MAMIAVCLSVTFVICGRANEGSGGLESQVRGNLGRRGGLLGVRGWGKQREGYEGGTAAVRELIFCVSVADLLVWKRIFSLSDSINLPHLS